jgi:hypothetical protein
MTNDELVALLHRLYPSSPWPKPFGLLRVSSELASGTRSVAEVARELKVSRKRVSDFASSPDTVSAIFGAEPPSDKAKKSARQMLGNLIAGRCAERIFVERYKKEAATTELTLSDLRESRSDTDYRLLNGRGRPVYRINIKFIGSLFRQAPELVGLQPDDCFALATYKIGAATQKQEADKLPFLFIVVSVPGLSTATVGANAPADFLGFFELLTQATGIEGKRNIQDRVIDLLESSSHPYFAQVLSEIEHGRWFVLSARRANILLRSMLFERVYALRVRGFAQQYRGAELNMHFSLSKDLTTLDQYLRTLKVSGYPMVTTLLERGEY